MKALRQQWKAIEARYAALTRRERIIVAGALVLGPWLIGNALLVEPLSMRAKVLASNIARQEASIADLQAQVVTLGQQLQNDPDAQRKAELAALQQASEALDEEMRSVGEGLVRPEEMNGLLDHFLAKQTGVRLVSLKTLSPRSVLANVPAPNGAEKKAPERAFDLFRHGVEIRLEGNYGQLMAYLAQMETEKSRLLLERVTYRVIDYPRAEMTVNVYTLSSDRAWLSL